MIILVQLKQIIFILCLSILNLLEFYIISNYQDNTRNDDKGDHSDNANSIYNTNETNPEESQLSTNQHKLKFVKSSNQINSKGNFNYNSNDALIQKINNELLRRIISPKKYGGFDSNGNYIILISQSKQLFKDYVQLNQNYNSSSRKVQLDTFNQNNNKHSRLTTHKTSHSKSKNNEHMNSIEQLYKEGAKKKIQHEKEIEKYNQHKLNEELKLCTFKPKINTNSYYKSNIVHADNATAPTQK